jgi:membrane-associated phospholipid phosphatase
MTTFKALRLFLAGCIGLCLFFLLGMVISYQHSPLTSLDQTSHNYAVSLRTPAMTAAMFAITSLGDTDKAHELAMAAIVLMICFGFWRIAACTALGFWLNTLLTDHFKAFFNIARPGQSLQATGNKSFPSGHTTNVAIIFFMLGWFALLSIKHRLWRNVVLSLCALVTLAVGVSRIYLGVHWLSDIYGAILLVASTGLIIISISELINNFWKRHA